MIKSLPSRKRVVTFIIENAVSVFLVGFVIFMVFTKRSFSTWDNIVNIINESSIYGIAACAMTVVVISGEFDLSASSIFGWSTVLFTICCNTIGVLGAFIVTLLCGALFGAFNGFLVAKVKMPAFVVTLGTMIAIRGLAYVVTKAQPINTNNPTLKAISQIHIGDISIIPMVYLAVIILFVWFLRYTKFGRDIYATGGNYEVARLSGINVVFSKFIVFTMLGAAAALAAIMYGVRIKAGWAPYGQDLSLHCITATIIGGTSMLGGNGGVHKTVIGVILLAVLFNALTLLGVSGSMQKFIRGLVLITVIMLDAVVAKRKKE
ncbi:MAG: ABC transporter permease [Sphaerochaetaceae bacterium]|jgi:ribose transport system permease protein|nr:ABC transporter permease [Sphaerochaetaceae bacterium]HHU89389.1 ABC transporter permease [Spirochaetales bacterium]